MKPQWNADEFEKSVREEAARTSEAKQPAGKATAPNVGKAAPAWHEDSFTAEQLQAMTFPPVSWIVSDIIPGEGLTLLCSKPKFGKSWLAYDLCIACTMGRLTLGEKRPAQGGVLYLALEDSKRRLQRRMQKLLPAFKAKWPDKLTIKTEWRRLHEGGLDDIRAWHAATKAAGGEPIMAVIDVLAKVRKHVGNRQIYEADYEAVGALSALAHELGVALVVIHHTRKMAADDLMETVSGSFGTTGAADTILILANKAGGAVLDIRGRDVESNELAITFQKESCKWTILGNAAEIHVSEQRSKILAALKEAAAPMKVAALMEATGIKRNPLDLLLGKMAKDGSIKRLGSGLYAHKDYEPPPPDKTGRNKPPLAANQTDQTDGQKGQKAIDSTGKSKSGDLSDDLSASNRPDRKEDSASISVRPPQAGQISGQIKKRVQETKTTAKKDQICPPVRSVGVGVDGEIAANGYAISHSPENRQPGPACRVTIRQIFHPAIKSGPDDDMDDFVAL